jgi:acyl-CoA dehydrogenase
MTSLLLSRRDLEFMLHEWLEAESLISFAPFAGFDRQSFDAILNVCEQLAKDFFSPHNKKNDQHEPQFDGERVTINKEVQIALRAFIDAGLMSATAPAEMGGMQLPSLLFTASMGYFFSANIGTSAFPTLSIGNANTVLAHGTSAQISAFAKPIYEGRFFGTMCLSEPQAGSSLSDITTRAEYDGESPLGPRYRLTGRKMWISAGEHELSENIVHLVLAKVPDEDGNLISGVKGISLFIVPKYLVDEQGRVGERNDVVLAGLNHKMGQRGVTNCLLNFGEGTRFRPQGKAGAVGYLIGNLQCGLLYMFHMMNEARIGVGLAASALGYTGYLHALEYARNRPQGRPVQSDGKESAKPPVAIIEHPDVKRMLLAQKAYVEGGLGLVLYCAK